MMKIAIRTVAAGAFGAATLLTLGACSTATDLTAPTATTSVEQTMSPSPSADAGFVLRTATEDDWPALADGYVFSDAPQSDAEQYIFDTYPDLWAQGVRALSPKYIDPYTFGDEKVPGATVQYVNGVRYEGTNQMPLGFRGQLDNPAVMPTDAIDNTVASLQAPTARHDNTGQGGYVIDIVENMNNERRVGSGIDQSNDTKLIVSAGDGRQIGETMRFADWESAWSHLQTNGFKVDGQERALYPGEVANVKVLREVLDAQNQNNGYTGWVWDPASSSWVLAVDQSH